MMTSTKLPQRQYTYQNHQLDSTYWAGFNPRNDDIIIATYLNGGTTWMQTIVANLVFQGKKTPGPVWQLSPWIDFPPTDIEENLALI